MKANQKPGHILQILPAIILIILLFALSGHSQIYLASTSGYDAHRFLRQALYFITDFTPLGRGEHFIVDLTRFTYSHWLGYSLFPTILFLTIIIQILMSPIEYRIKESIIHKALLLSPGLAFLSQTGKDALVLASLISLMISYWSLENRKKHHLFYKLQLNQILVTSVIVSFAMYAKGITIVVYLFIFANLVASRHLTPLKSNLFACSGLLLSLPLGLYARGSFVLEDIEASSVGFTRMALAVSGSELNAAGLAKRGIRAIMYIGYIFINGPTWLIRYTENYIFEQLLFGFSGLASIASPYLLSKAFRKIYCLQVTFAAAIFGFCYPFFHFRYFVIAMAIIFFWNVYYSSAETRRA